MKRSEMILGILAGCMAALLCLPPAGSGAVFCVDSAQEIQSAMDTAAANGENDVIRIVMGRYCGNFTYKAQEAYDLVIEGGWNPPCTERFVDPENTIVTGNSTGTVFSLTGSGGDLVVDAVTLQDGLADDPGGGGLHVSGPSTLTVSNNMIFQNRTDYKGAGVYVAGTTSVTFFQNTFCHNTANPQETQTDGGGFYVTGATRLEIEGNTIFQNKTGRDGAGGAVESTQTAVFTENRFSQNESGDNGGGLYTSTISTALTLTENTLFGNTSHRDGGGLYVSGSSDVSLTDNTISHNIVEYGGGSGLYLSATTAVLTNNSLTDNSAVSDPQLSGGGGAYLTGGDFTLENNTVSGNSLEENDGGGICAKTATSLTAINNDVSANWADFHGGVYTYNVVDVILDSNTVYGNTASYGGGGGVFVSGTATDSVTVTNNVIAANDAGSGGGVYVSQTNELSLINNTITENQATKEGGGIRLSFDDDNATGDIYNNIIWNNAAAIASDIWINNDGDGNFTASEVHVKNNDFDPGAGGTYYEMPNQINASGNLVNQAPLFAAPATGDFHVLCCPAASASPCVDAGIATDANNSRFSAPATDKDGRTRPAGTDVDIGAYECCESCTPTAEFTGDPVSGEAPLTVQFTNTSCGDISSYDWDFGDGKTSTVKEPTHTYANAGTYTVKLAVSGPLGNADLEKPDYITATDVAPLPDMKINGVDGMIFLDPKVPAEVTVSLDPGSLPGEKCDWWIGAFTSAGSYWLNPALAWIPSKAPISVGQYGLFDLQVTQVLLRTLPRGISIFFYVLDENADGVLNDVTWFDRVDVVCGTPYSRPQFEEMDLPKALRQELRGLLAP